MQNKNKNLNIEAAIQAQKAQIEQLLKVLSIQNEETLKDLLRAEYKLTDLENGILQQAKYQPTLEQIKERKESLEEDGWTDATESNIDENEIIFLDDDIVEEMQQSDEEENENNFLSQEKQNIALQHQKLNEQLETQFITNRQSFHHILFTKHTSFCVSVCASKRFLFSGGGDDQLNIYSSEITENMIVPITKIKHSETVTKIEVTFDDSHVFSLTQNQLMLTELFSFKEQKIDISEPTDFACHKFGGVFAVSHDYSVDIYNLKGPSLYNSYCCDAEIERIYWSPNGKQLILVCDSKLRVLTVRTGEIIKVNTPHKSSIAALSLANNLVFSGDIDGLLSVTSLQKGSVFGCSNSISSAITNLLFTESYLLCGPQEPSLHWFDVNKMVRLFSNELEDNSTDFVNVQQNVVAVSDLVGNLYFFDRRNPLQQIKHTKAGNTIHQLTTYQDTIFAACEDGSVRAFDFKKIV